MVYPFYEELKKLSQNMNQGNFGLWYNKLIPLNSFEKCEACGKDSKKESAVELYVCKYNDFKNKGDINKILKNKQHDQIKFCNSFSSRYEAVIFTARLKTPLTTGIGETHPHEISMVFDHNIGIPYIPASGIKGITRFAHTLGLIDSIPEGKLNEDNGHLWFDDEEDWTNIPHLFGKQTRKGFVIFLDAYPEHIPELHIDIMNPHYGDYYSDDNNKIPPADYLNPVPIKFLTVAKNTVFIFRALVNKEPSELIEKVKAAFRKALVEEGVGAKTAIGYGMFEITCDAEPESILKIVQTEEDAEEQKSIELKKEEELQHIANLSEDEKLIGEIGNLTRDPNLIAPVVKKCLDGNFKQDVYVALKKKLEELGELKPDGSKKRKEGMKERNQKIEAKIKNYA